MGAAIQGGVLRGDVKDILLLDVTPLRSAQYRAVPHITVGVAAPRLTCRRGDVLTAQQRFAAEFEAFTARNSI